MGKTLIFLHQLSWESGLTRWAGLLVYCTNSVGSQGLQDGQDFYFPAPTQPGNLSKNQVKTFIFPHQLSLETELKRWAGFKFPAPTQYLLSKFYSNKQYT